MKRDRVWAVVMNAVRARIVRDTEERSGVRDLVVRAKQRHLRDMMADRPGRSFSSAGPRRSAMEYGSDPVREDMRAFAAEVVARLEEHRLAGDFDHLAVVATPQMLGILRPALTEGVRRIVVKETAKDLVSLPDAELKAAIRTILRPGATA